MKPAIVSNQGLWIDYVNLENNQYVIQDIAHALSHLCRFTGHCQRFYSVAEHSINVCNLLPKHLKLQGLLHDATEAYLGDVNTPLKSLLPEYKKIEENLRKSIFKFYNLPLELPQEVHDADYEMLCREWYRLMPEKYLFVPKQIVDLPTMTSYQAEETFLDMYYEFISF